MFIIWKSLHIDNNQLNYFVDFKPKLNIETKIVKDEQKENTKRILNKINERTKKRRRLTINKESENYIIYNNLKTEEIRNYFYDIHYNDIDQYQNVLHCWTNLKDNNKILFQFGSPYLCIPSTNASLERCWNLARNILTDYRFNLSHLYKH